MHTSAIWASVPKYLPAAQLVHSAVPAAVVYVPAGQLTHTSADWKPVPKYLPSGQAMQSDSAVDEGVVLYLPAAQSLQAVPPSS